MYSRLCTIEHLFLVLALKHGFESCNNDFPVIFPCPCSKHSLLLYIKYFEHYFEQVHLEVK